MSLNSIDVNNGQSGINLAASNADSVNMKVTEGTNHVSPDFNRQYKQDKTSTTSSKPTQQGYKYSIGTVATFGGVFKSSKQASTANANDGYTPASSLAKNYGRITKQMKVNGRSVYLIDNGFGWINDDNVTRIGGATQPNAQYHTVKPGDTLSSIADEYKTTYKQLVELNSIPNPNTVFAGQCLRVK